MKKFLRIAVALMAVFAMTNFIACSTGDDPVGTSNSSETGGTTGGTGSSGETGGSGSGETGGSGSGETGGSGSGETGGSGSGETGGSGSSETPGVVGEYKVVYAGETVMEGLTQEAANAMATEFGLVENTDYTINNETKIITLTESGMAKVDAAESGSGEGEAPSNPGAGSNPSNPGAGIEKLNLTVDITTLSFAETTAGLTDTAAADKNGTYMIPAGATILDALTSTKDDKAFWYTDKNRTKISALQLNGEGELAFVLTNPATVKVTFLSTGDTNTSAITINGTANSVTGKTATEFSWEIAEAGIYKIASTGTSNARITAISIVEK